MTSLPALVATALADAVAMLGADGVLVPRTEAMRDWIDAAGGGAAPTLHTLGVTAADADALSHGEVVVVRSAARSWRVRLVGEGPQRWVVAQDTTAATREAAAAVELLRLRTLAATASTLVHDFNNLLNAAIGLAQQLGPLARSPQEVAAVQELARGTHQGAHLARTLGRLLARGAADASVVPVTELTGDAVALASKAATLLRLRIDVEAPTSPPTVRVATTEAVQALWHGLMTLVECAPRELAVVVAARDEVLSASRTRRWASVCLRARGVTPAHAAEIVQLAGGAPGGLALLARRPHSGAFAAVVYMQRRIGGDLLVTTRDDEVAIEYRWPAVS